jgi:HEAT repeat protein
MVDGVQGQVDGVGPEGILRSALEKIVFFECRVAQLESELQAARTTAERARADAAEARRREVELNQTAAAERGARADADARVEDLVERVRLYEGERERLLAGLVEHARVGGATGADGAPGPEENGADLAGFIAELRAEIEALRAWKAQAEAAGIRGPAGAIHAARGERSAESMPALAERFRAEGRVGISGRDADRLKDLLTTRADRVLYERSMDDLGVPDARTRLRAVRALEALGARAAAPLLAAALGREGDESVKAAILSALGRFREPFAADLCTRALDDARPAVRVAALEALASLAVADAEPRLTRALGDPSPLVRRRAALLLGFTAGDRAEAALSVALGDPDRGVARAAAAALSGRPTARAQGALARALEHPHQSVRRAAAATLARVSGEPVPADGSAPTLRAASRRVAAKLAAMDGRALREAVLSGAGELPVVEARAAVPAPVRAQAPAHAAPVQVARAPALAPRAATAVAVLEPPPAPAAPSALEQTIVFEVRAALRGSSPPELATALSAPLTAVVAALELLRVRGTLVQRGARWFTA